MKSISQAEIDAFSTVDLESKDSLFVLLSQERLIDLQWQFFKLYMLQFWNHGPQIWVSEAPKRYLSYK